jgi:hypothetical protein
LSIRVDGRWRLLVWPRADIAKNRIARLLRRPLRACPTSLLSATAPHRAPVPGCVKPMVGSNRRGFRVYRTVAAFRALKARLRRGFVVQPLLEGIEFRVTACADGTFAAARVGNSRSVWRDASTTFPRGDVKALVGIVRALEAPGAGFDIISSAGRSTVLDINLAPFLPLHCWTDRPRDLVPSYLRSWFLLRGLPPPGQPGPGRRAGR